MAGDVPVQFVTEAWFYVAGAALEARQPTAAAEAFRTSEKIGIESELYQIRNLYLRQTYITESRVSWWSISEVDGTGSLVRVRYLEAAD